jgi:aminodeoxyfutalosine deaminase
MRKISADYIFPITSPPIANGVVVIDEQGVIVDICSKESIAEIQDIEYYSGIICPGFINTHCHLELSHMRSQIPEQLGLTGFVKEIITKRNLFTEAQVQEAIVQAEQEMINNGIVAVGDISNNNSTFKQKAKQNLYYHTFIETFDLNPEKADDVFESALSLREQLLTLDFKLSNSITPHAPYTVSDKLSKYISDKAAENNSLISIHNQESEAENELFMHKTGNIVENFTQMGINMDFIQQTGRSSLQSYFHKLPSNSKKLFVHNTFTSKEDVQFLEDIDLKIGDTRCEIQDGRCENQDMRFERKDSSLMSQVSNLKSIYWCTCPNANLYIENKLPDYSFFINSGATLTIGTDSLASNWSLSVLDELKTIQRYNPKIPLQTLLTWATKNGADFLGLDYLGSLEKGKKPGLLLLQGISDFEIKDNSSVKRIV